MFKYWKILIILFIPLLGRGQMLTDEQQNIQSTDKKSDTGEFHITGSSAILTSLHRFEDPNKVFGTDMKLYTSYTRNGYTAFLSLGGFKDFEDKREWFWSDSSLGISTSLGSLGDVSVSGTLTSIIPLSEQSRDYRGMQTGFVVYPSFTLPLTEYGLKGVSVNYRPTASAYFHKYEVSLGGVSNTQYSLSHRLRLSYAISSKFSLSISTTYQRSWTYVGNTQDTFGFDASLGYAPNNWLSLELGSTTSGTPLKANGTETELTLFDTRETLLYLALGIRY